ncbi:hypothetical protein HBB16_15335 [Pseudonocardia sp. MCCB 268]|nr:hypothetical protein [Pseudonocardia cytotoxica]
MLHEILGRAVSLRCRRRNALSGSASRGSGTNQGGPQVVDRVVARHVQQRRRRGPPAMTRRSRDLGPGGQRHQADWSPSAPHRARPPGVRDPMAIHL